METQNQIKRTLSQPEAIEYVRSILSITQDVTVHPLPPLPHQGGGIYKFVSPVAGKRPCKPIPRSWWEGLGEGVNCYEKCNIADHVVI